LERDPDRHVPRLADDRNDSVFLANARDFYRQYRFPGFIKPDDVHGIKVRWAILDPSSADIKELTHSSFDTRGPLILEFPEHGQGKRVYIAGPREIERWRMGWIDGRGREGGDVEYQGAEGLSLGSGLRKRASVSPFGAKLDPQSNHPHHHKRKTGAVRHYAVILALFSRFFPSD
jgi:hypothetical protein